MKQKAIHQMIHKAVVLTLSSMLMFSMGACGQKDHKEQDAYRISERIGSVSGQSR